MRFRNEDNYRFPKHIVDEEATDGLYATKNNAASDLPNVDRSSTEPEVPIEIVKKLKFKKHQRRLISSSDYKINDDRDVKINGTENFHNTLLSSDVNAESTRDRRNEDRPSSEENRVVTVVSQLVHWRFAFFSS